MRPANRPNDPIRRERVQRVDALTPAQEARFAEWRDKWIEIGLCTDPADRQRFERAVSECYRAAGLCPPTRVVWVQSPVVLAFAGPIAAYLVGAVRDAVGGAVRDAVDGAVGDAVGDAVGGAVRGAVHDAVGGAVGDNWYRYLGGQFWVGGYWGGPAIVSFFREVCGLRLPGDMDTRALALEATGTAACWWWPHREFVVACDRPRVIHRDDRGRLHCETGMAIEFRDGWGVSAWHGTAVPHEWVADRVNLAPSVALTWPNVEQRRAAAEIVGWARVLASVPHKTIDRDSDPQVGELFEVDLPDAPGSRFLRVLCATKREFVIPVPRESRTALEANCWTYDLDPEVFKRSEGRT